MGLRQLETKKVTVGDNDFYIKPFPAFKSVNLVGELASTLTPLLSAVMPLLDDKEDKENKSLMDTDATEAAQLMAGAATGISGDKIERLMKKLLTENKNIICVEVNEDGVEEQKYLTEDIANEIFCEDVQDMFILAFEVIRRNFNGFFKKVTARSGVQKLAETVKREII